MFSVDSGCFVARLKSRVYTFGGYWEAFEVENSKCLILWGMNPHASRFPTSKVIEEKVESGDMKLIVIDPRKIPFAKKGKHISIRPGTDMALALGVGTSVRGSCHCRAYTLFGEAVAHAFGPPEMAIDPRSNEDN